MQVEYDGETHTITLVGLPEKVVVTYAGGDKSDAGEYTVTATLTLSADDAEYYELVGSTTLNAKLTITKEDEFPWILIIILGSLALLLATAVSVFFINRQKKNKSNGYTK